MCVSTRQGPEKTLFSFPRKKRAFEFYRIIFMHVHQPIYILYLYNNFKKLSKRQQKYAKEEKRERNLPKSYTEYLRWQGGSYTSLRHIIGITNQTSANWCRNFCVDSSATQTKPSHYVPLIRVQEREKSKSSQTYWSCLLGNRI